MEIRKKEKVSITEAWKNEEKDFTPWLIKNLDELSKTMRQNITVTDAQREVRSGRYELDILGKIGNDNVIIENMYGKTNHDHLGKCITYAAIHKAKYLIWIAETFQPEELTSVDWLNENFSVESGINFFAVEISVWKSVDEKGNSSDYVIPHFKVLREPNVGVKQIRDEKHAASVTEKKEKRKIFFEDFFAKYGKINSKWVDHKSNYDNWANISAGSGSSIYFTVVFKGNSNEGVPTLELSIRNSSAEKNEKIYQDLYKDKESIEKKWKQVSDNELLWIRDEEVNYRDIRVKSDLEIDFSTADEELKKKCMDWFIENMKKFEDVFTPIVNELSKNRY